MFDRCVVRFDHYCPWVYNVVGGKNHRVFVVFLTATVLAQALFCVVAFPCTIWPCRSSAFSAPNRRGPPRALGACGP